MTKVVVLGATGYVGAQIAHDSGEEVFRQYPTAARRYKMRIERCTAGCKCSICSRRKPVFRVNDLATTTQDS